MVMGEQEHGRGARGRLYPKPIEWGEPGGGVTPGVGLFDVNGRLRAFMPVAGGVAWAVSDAFASAVEDAEAGRFVQRPQRLRPDRGREQ